MSGRRSERHRRAISDPQCRESCFYSMKLGTYIFLHLNIRNTHVFITSQHFQHLLYTQFISEKSSQIIGAVIDVTGGTLI